MICRNLIGAGLTVMCLLPGCNRTDQPSENREHLFFDQAEFNGKLVNEGFNRCLNYTNAWLGLADKETGLIPRNIIDPGSRDIWNAKDCGADNYPFMVLTCALLDQDLFNGRMSEILRTETKITSRIGSLPDTYSFSKHGFLNNQVNPEDIIFGSSEYVKDGLIPLTEWIGPSPWSERMISIINDELKYAQVKTKSGNIISDNAEVNGDMLQSLSRIYWMTGNSKYLEEAIRIGDYYLLGNNHPTRNFKVLRLRDHGCEIISGLCELYATLSYCDTVKKNEYRSPLYEMLDRILETGRNADGLFYNSIDPVRGIPVDGAIADNFGYTLNGFYTVWLIDHIKKYRDPVIKALSVLNEKYRNFPWEGSSADGYADAIEGALNLDVREPSTSTEQWMNSEIKVMWSKQKKSGLIEGWHGDGNFARTTIMYCLWKTAGTYLMPWRQDLEYGAIMDDSLLYLSIYAVQDWDGKLMFDKKRHSEFLHLPVDWPRINQFPEYFTVVADVKYEIRTSEKKNILIIPGNELRKGLPLKIGKGEYLRLRIRKLT
jgi:hypothetical protein